MKRVLITGANSYLGDNTKKYLEKSGEYVVDILDMLDPNWKTANFSKYDVIFNVCAIVHRVNKVDESLYYKVNRDLAVEIAKKAKKEGVKQFIQTSTNGVFGLDIGIMSIDKGFNPKTPYEKSKYEADCSIEQLRNSNFKVCIIRPPLIYGKGCKGNFPKLENFAKHKKIYPTIKNKRDFIYIENITDFVKFAIDNEIDGIYYPRDKEPVEVLEMIKIIASSNNNLILFLGLLNPFVKMLMPFSRKLRLVFGNNYFIGKSDCGWIPIFDSITALKNIYSKENVSKK